MSELETADNQRFLVEFAEWLTTSIGVTVTPDTLRRALMSQMKWVRKYPVEVDEYLQLFALKAMEMSRHIESVTEESAAQEALFTRVAGRARYDIIRAIAKTIPLTQQHTARLKADNNDSDTVAERLANMEIYKRVLKFVTEKMSTDEQLLLDASMSQMNSTDLAKMFNTSPSTVRQRKSRLLKRVRELAKSIHQS